MKSILAFASVALVAALFFVAPALGAIVVGLVLLIFAPEIASGARAVLSGLRTREARIVGAIAAVAAAVSAVFAIGAGAALAGETISITLPDVWPTTATGWAALIWGWVGPYFTVSGVVGLALALLPQGADGSVWDKLRTVLNFVAHNFGNAKNIRTA